MGPRALSPPASLLRLRWLLACGLLGPVLDAGRPGGCRGNGVPGSAASRAGCFPECPVVRAARWTPGFPALLALSPEPGARRPAAPWPCARRSRAGASTWRVEWLSLALGWELELLLQSIRI